MFKVMLLLVKNCDFFFHVTEQIKGEITYNGSKLNEFVPQKTSAYISQNDVHVGEMTVKETLDFSARCQGVGTRYGNILILVKILF